MNYAAPCILAVTLATAPITFSQQSFGTAATAPKPDKANGNWVEVIGGLASTANTLSKTTTALTETSIPADFNERITLESIESASLTPLLIAIDNLQGPSPNALEMAKRWLICAKALATKHDLSWSNPLIGAMDTACIFEWALTNSQLLVSVNGTDISYDSVAIHESHFQIDDDTIASDGDTLKLLRIIAG